VLAPGRGPARPAPCRCRIAVVSVLGLLALVLAVRTPVLTAVPAWSWLLLLAALLAPAVFVELPLCVVNRRVQVAELYEAALLVALSLRTGVWLALVTSVVTVLRDSYLHRSHRRAEPLLGARPPRVWGGRPLARPPALVLRRVATQRCCRRRGSCATRSSHARVTLMHAASAPPWIKQSDIPRCSNE